MNDEDDYEYEFEDLPIGAFKGFEPSRETDEFEINDGWLESANRGQQITAMRAWFTSRYCDPAHGTPYNSREGGYLFIHGGPFDPAEELPERFAQFVDEDIIQEVVDDLVNEVGDEWAPIERNQTSFDFDYDDAFAISLDRRDRPREALSNRIERAQRILSLRGEEDVELLTRNLVFGSVFTALEAYLWETVLYYVENDDDVVRMFITSLPHLADEKISLREIYERHEGLKSHVKAYLQNAVWHRFDHVGAIYRSGLGIRLPSVRAFVDASKMRHDIVHRSGRNVEGEDVIVTVEQIDVLVLAIDEFADALEGLLAPRRTAIEDRIPI